MKFICPTWITEKLDGFIVTVFVQPRASKNMVAGLHGEALKVRLTAPPVDNAANKMCVEFLSKCLKIPKSSLEIVSGQTGRTKHIFVRATDDKQALMRKIEALAD
ncbi:MAG: DUF167 domain-containing protein [Desulfobacterales bacterium]|jgi:uncharacterized protein (TIGR00251 family)|nr:DUF167 domain-containing protein [Desulfobacterales bacterium]